MSDSTASLSHKIDSAGELQSVVRTMKALAASSIGQYEKSVRSLADYYKAVELGLGACLREAPQVQSDLNDTADARPIGAIIFGSDQGLVGQFNEVVADYAISALAALPGASQVWAVGERVYARLADANMPLKGLFPVPNSVGAITPLVGHIQVEIEVDCLYVFYNRPLSGSLYEPTGLRLLPLDQEWRQGLIDQPWPTKLPPEVMSGVNSTLRALIREHLFISLFRACAESLASENSSRLAAMERAERNIVDLLETLTGAYHRVRQTGIDEELFDVISGFEALTKRS